MASTSRAMRRIGSATTSARSAPGSARRASQSRNRGETVQPPSQETSTPMKILLVLTSHDTLGNTGRKTGFWLEEGAAPYYVFRDAGVTLTLASSKGGQPPVDPESDDPGNQTPAMARFKQDPAAQKDFATTAKLKDMPS